MRLLPYPDKMHLDAAHGWLLLGNSNEAALEFLKVSRAHETHPDYLQIQCRLLIAKREWPAALAIGKRQIQMTPGRPQGWLNRAFCLHEMKRTREALSILLPAARWFPRHQLISFNLACYCCHLERFQEALRWINRTIELLDGDVGI